MGSMQKSSTIMKPSSHSQEKKPRNMYVKTIHYLLDTEAIVRPFALMQVELDGHESFSKHSSISKQSPQWYSNPGKHSTTQLPEA